MLAALETSTRACSVALLETARGEIVAETLLSEESEGASALIPALEELLSGRGLKASDLTALAATVGPGSFTGIRVGLATVQGLSLPSKIPAFGVSTLDALAENLLLDEWFGEALCLLDAQRGECFMGHYRISPEGFSPLSPARILGPNRFPEFLEGKATLAGPGALKYEREIREALGTRSLFPFAPSHRMRASSVARLAWERWKKGERPDLESLQPQYLRLPTPVEKQVRS